MSNCKVKLTPDPYDKNKALIFNVYRISPSGDISNNKYFSQESDAIANLESIKKTCLIFDNSESNVFERVEYHDLNRTIKRLILKTGVIYEYCQHELN